MSWRRDPGKTIELLASDRALAKHVLDLRLCTPEFKTRTPAYYMDAIQKMTSLKKLTLSGSSLIFNDSVEQKLFAESVSRRQTPLEEFRFLLWNIKFPGEDFPLSSFKLKEVEGIGMQL